MEEEKAALVSIFNLPPAPPQERTTGSEVSMIPRLFPFLLRLVSALVDGCRGDAAEEARAACGVMGAGRKERAAAAANLSISRVSSPIRAATSSVWRPGIG